MKCGITGYTGTHIPLNLFEHAKGHYHDRVKDFIENMEDIEKISGIIDSINSHMENKYQRKDNDILMFYGMRKYISFNGVAYIFSDTDIKMKIKGEVFIVPLTVNDKIVEFFYIFRTILRTPFTNCPPSVESTILYEPYFRELDNFLYKLDLKRSDILYGSGDKYFQVGIHPRFIPKDVGYNPVIYENIKNLDLQSFDIFMDKVVVIAEKYLLQTIGRRCRDFGTALK